MKKIPQLFFLFILMMTSTHSYSQGYKIDVTIEGLDNSNLFLGYYFNGKTFLRDTAKYVGEGKYTFEGDEPISQGMYFLAKNTTLMFDLVIGEDQYFELQTREEDFLTAMEVIGDKDNQLFYDNMRFNAEMGEKINPYIELSKDSTTTEEENAKALEEITAINASVGEYQNGIISEYPNSILATLFKAGQQVEIPEELRSNDEENGRKRMLYYRAHYWDQFDLGNSVLLRLPRSIYFEKVDDYLDNLIPTIPDSLKVAVDNLIAVAKRDEDTHQSLVWHLTIKYQTSKIMGLDELYVHLVDNYFLTGEMDYWANDQLKKNLKEKADQYRNSLIGMVAPNLVLQDLAKQPKALHDLKNSYSVIYFYDPDCGHCKKETPVLKAFSESTNHDVGVYSVSADTSMVKMRDYINEMELQNWVNTNGTRSYGLNYQEVYDAYTTPTIYVLNDKKEIIAKKIGAGQLEELIANYEKFKQ